MRLRGRGQHSPDVALKLRALVGKETDIVRETASSELKQRPHFLSQQSLRRRGRRCGW